MNKIIIVFSLSVFSFLSHAQVSKSYSGTTWLKSTTGAGVGSILMDEATMLNPAPIAFYQMSSIYFQKSQSTHLSANLDRNNTETGDTIAVISDSKGRVGGSISYISSKLLDSENKRMAVAIATPVREGTSVGISYSDTTEKNPLVKNNFKQFNMGVTHLINSSVTMGIVATDIKRQREEDSKVTLGMQYVFNNFISLMLDIGGDYKRQLSEYYLYRTAIQFKIMDDFFLRLGRSEDFILSQRTTGVGAGWVSPKMVINASFSDVKGMKVGDDSAKESGFSLALKF